MAPAKFDDFPKVAADMLNDDYQTSGYKLKAKQKTNFDGAVITTDVELFPDKADTMTPAKLTWKLPSPFGLGVVVVDKLEVDKAGKMKLEMSSDKAYPGLKVDAKSDLVDVSKISAGATFTGVKDTQIKFETIAMNPADFSCEATRSQGPGLTFGLKCTAATLTAPDLGVRYQQGPLFCSLLAKETFSVYTAHLHYKASEDLKLAATYEHGGKKNGAFTAGLLYQAAKGTAVKSKFQHDGSIHLGVKREMSKGFNVLCGCKIDTKASQHTYGLQLSIE
jgi:hypothetical protein